ncbi:DUF2167 domain-containing protein [Eleftheria terrae]|nr:DUF2167 domain-containing protein [Eleftheria terrae]WKB53927.1 DUF2167 domain-containing protein [Eleftheria terrae]
MVSSTACTSALAVPALLNRLSPLMRRVAAAALLTLGAAVLPAAPAWSGEAEPNASVQAGLDAELAAASQAAQAAQTVGPADIKVRDQAVLHLPKGYVWVPQTQANRLMRAMGNTVDNRMVGLVFPAGEEKWMVAAEFEPAGYVKDDDARDWDIDELYTSLKDGTEAGNEDRKSRGFQELEIGPWVEKPTYDSSNHRLVWALSVRDKGAPADGTQSINYNTYALGREGYVSLNLITELKDIGQDKVHAATLLSALEYNAGKRYADFDASTDKVASYGLAALIAGGAAKKLGLFAVIGAFLAKFAKVALLAGAGLIAGVAKLFKRKAAAE